MSCYQPDAGGTNPRSRRLARPNTFVVLTCDFHDLGHRSRVSGVNTKDGLRMLRSAPALSLDAVAAGVGTPARDLKLALGQLQGRGHCDKLASASTARRRGTPRRRSVIRQSVLCPPFAVRRAAWDESRSVKDNTPGVAGWSSRSVDSAAAPRAAFTKAAAQPTTRFRAVQRPDGPPMIVARLRAIEPFTTALLAAEARIRRRSPLWSPSATTNPLTVAASRDELRPMQQDL